jgi:hypothetical protein
MLETRPTRINRSLGIGCAADTALVELPERSVSGAEHETGSVHDQDAGRHAENLDDKAAQFRRDTRFTDYDALSRHRFGVE